MRIWNNFDIKTGALQNSAVTIGNFDGVHRGHLALFERLIADAAGMGLRSVAVTFEPHPLRLLAPESAPPLIATFDQKLALIEATGIDDLVVVPFTREIADMPADDFVTVLLCDSLGMRHIVIGHDYAFGRGREGNYCTLERLRSERGFSLEYMEPVGDERVIFSSSSVRKAIAEGDMSTAAAILGRYHLIAGTVVHGCEIGHSIGYPTANIESGNELLPPDGVYAVMVSVEGRLVKGACNIGKNLTFDRTTRTIEVFLLDYSGQIYGREITLWFVQKLRDVIKFAGVPALVDAIAQDVQQTREILAAADPSKIEPKMLK